uniref:Uncharacterized protein n=1 Tax=Oryza rufipogon TaxID=4529 RepID=A0A0E0P1G5_ORYRU
MAMASTLPLLLVHRSTPPTPRPTAPPLLHSRRLALPPRPASLPATTVVVHPHKDVRLSKLHAASCCDSANSSFLRCPNMSYSKIRIIRVSN